MKIRYKIRDEFAKIAESQLFKKQNKMCWWALCLNESPGAIDILSRNQDKIEWGFLSKNKYAIPLLQQNFDKICFMYLCRENQNAIEILQHMSLEDIYMQWSNAFGDLSENPSVEVIKFLEKHIDKIDWYRLSSNYNAIHLLRANMSKINWSQLSRNKNARDLLLANPEKINWSELSANENMIDIIEKNLDKIDWDNISENANALHILEKNPDKVNALKLETILKTKEALELYLKLYPEPYRAFLTSPCIFEIDYDAMRKEMQQSGLAEEIISTALHPNRVTKWVDLGFNDF